ncbi:hypothetical protein J8C02_14345 [Chloracidobacterium sp. MS 40/45]|uniref:hypothetical protein n=1 Tax=Chloracidobacterium aggregatum TaxID=2851959 RepID=UPI001B8AF227|nr:hypothetical protein [Chloracidobacterium aggregatum]QUW01316.1 hypothetical protein J8C02_14345 [Chloracidobacterium sp. MS 40/45]
MRRESYLLSNGRSIVFTERKLWLTRNGELSDVLKSLLAVGFAVVSFVTTMAAAAGLAQQVSLPGVLCLIAGSAGLYTTWLFFRQAMGAIAGLPELVLERSGDRLTVFGADYDLSTARFFGAWGVVGIRQGGVDIPLLQGLDADEADSLAAHLNATLLGDVTGLATQPALAAAPRLSAQA